MPAPIAPDKRQKIARLHAKGYSASAIAREIGADRHTVSRYLATKAAEGDKAPASGEMDALSADQAAILRALIKSTGFATCPECESRFVTLRSQSEGMCPNCGEHWRCTTAKSAPARQPRQAVAPKPRSRPVF